MQRVIACGDFHCGHRVGLTPPAWIPSRKGFGYNEDLLFRQWDFFATEIEKLRPIDTAIINGDLIDGKGKRSGGVEQIEIDLNRQAEMAEDVIKFIDAKKVFITNGTPYHVDDGAAVEEAIASNVGATIGGHLFLEIDGVVFDVKHKVGSSSVPHGRSTAIKRENLWNVLHSERNTNPKSDVILRSHVHYFDYTGNTTYLAMTLPALQGMGSKYGIEQCSGIVDFGFVHFDVTDGDYTWQPHILQQQEKAQALKV